MAGPGEAPNTSSLVSGKDEVRTRFSTREGEYRLVPLAEYSRTSRLNYTTPSPGQQGQQQGANPPVRLSFLSLPSDHDPSGFCDRLCFNHGRELYFYLYRGIDKVADISKPVDKRLYKGTSPTCHEANTVTASNDYISFLIGFTGGQVQLINPLKSDMGRLFNEDRAIEKTRVTCLRWVPKSHTHFLVAHASGHMYLYSEEVGPGNGSTPQLNPLKVGEGYSVHTCRVKGGTKNPILRWTIGEPPSAIHEMAFSPCAKYLALVSQDGFLRVFQYESLDLVGFARSYFGGLLSICWSPDGQYIAVGGEDDLVTVWSFAERRVVARGQGHRSWVTAVSFDAFTSSCGTPDPDSDDDVSVRQRQSTSSRSWNGTGHLDRNGGSGGDDLTCYRLGSVGQDTLLCLWDVTNDVLKQSCVKSRCSLLNSSGAGGSSLTVSSSSLSRKDKESKEDKEKNQNHKRHFSLTGVTGKMKQSGSGSFSLSTSNAAATATTVLAAGGTATTNGSSIRWDDPLRLIGTAACPRLDECPILEPLVCKKVSTERLSALSFRPDCLLTACQDGVVYTWERPKRPPDNNTGACPGSPPPPPPTGGTMV